MINRIYYNIIILFIRLFRIKLNKDKIPDGEYCYTTIGFDIRNGVLRTEKCPYYHSTNTEHINICLYEGYIGDDLLLRDQCKICEGKIRRK